MVNLIFAILFTPVLLIKYYELIKYRQKLSLKDWLLLILATTVVAATYLEKVFKIDV